MDENQQTVSDETKIAILPPIDKESVKTKIYEVRGHKVMIDKDIAVYFGVETKLLNRAMKRNIRRFPENFCFQLTILECSRFQIGTLNTGRGSNLKYLPYAYTEQGIAMLTSVLHTDRAIDASIQIMEAFVEMSHYISQNRQLLPYEEFRRLEAKHYQLADRVQNIEENMVTKADLSDLMKLFEPSISNEEILILDGEPFKADAAYQKIYKQAAESIIVIDDYLGVKTLQHLVHAKNSVNITIISNNKGNRPLRKSEYDDFRSEYSDREISFVKSENKTHDRYIVLDFGTKSERLYHCGASSKDAGRRITTITEIKGIAPYAETIRTLLANPPLMLG